MHHNGVHTGSSRRKLTGCDVGFPYARCRNQPQWLGKAQAVGAGCFIRLDVLAASHPGPVAERSSGGRSWMLWERPRQSGLAASSDLTCLLHRIQAQWLSGAQAVGAGCFAATQICIHPIECCCVALRFRCSVMSWCCHTHWLNSSLCMSCERPNPPLPGLNPDMGGYLPHPPPPHCASAFMHTHRHGDVSGTVMRHADMGKQFGMLRACACLSHLAGRQ